MNQAAVSDQGGELQLNMYERSTFSSALERPLNDGLDIRSIKTVDVASITLDDYSREHEIDAIDLLKIDVEGLEYRVMRGAEKLFAEQRVRACTFEFGTPTFYAGVDAGQIEALFRSYSYEVSNVVRGEPAFPGRKTPRPTPFSMMVALPT